MSDNSCLSQRWVTGIRDLDYYAYAVFIDDSDVLVRGCKGGRVIVVLVGKIFEVMHGKVIQTSIM